MWTPKIVEFLTSEFKEVLRELLNEIWKYKTIPTYWRVTLLIFKSWCKKQSSKQAFEWKEDPRSNNIHSETNSWKNIKSYIIICFIELTKAFDRVKRKQL